MHEKEGFVRFPLLQPFEGKVSDGIGGMLVGKLDEVFAPRFVPAYPKGGPVVFALPWKYAVIVKVLGFHLKMPFTDHGGFVSRLFHFYGEHLLAGFDSTSQIHGPIDVVVLTGQYASARRRAD